MVSAKTRRRMHNRRRRREQGWRYFTSKQFGVLVMTPLIAASFYVAATKQRSVAEAQAPIPQLALTAPAWVPTIAQSAIPLSRQGGQVTINGRSVAVAWSEWQERIGIADAGLMSALGVELLNTQDPKHQPIQWFSDPNTPLALSTWLTGQYRYLDITDLAKNAGWQVNSNGLALQISTPIAKIQNLRQGRQEWGDRVVVQLDQPTPWQLTEQRGQATIIVDADIEPTILRAFKGMRSSRVTDVTVVKQGDRRTAIRLNLPPDLRVQVSTLQNPHRLLIDVRPDFQEPKDITWAPGVRWQQQTVQLGRARFPVVSLEVNPQQSGVSLKPIVSNPINTVGIAPLSATAQRSQAAAAINGGFFNRNNQLPLGAIRKDGNWISGPILNRGAIAWNDQGEVALGRLVLQEVLTTANGQQLPLQSTNSGYVGEGVGRYTRDWGSSYTNVLESELLLTVENNQIVSQRRTDAKTKTTIPIPQDGYILVVRANRAAEQALPIGSSVRVRTSVLPQDFDRFPQVLGAGPLLLQNRQIVLNAAGEKFSPAFIREGAARSVIATTADGKVVLLAVHNRIGGTGPTLAEVARLTQQMGFVSALNLDGGSSTTLYLGGQLLDRIPSTAARLHNGIGVFIQPGS